MTGTDIAIRELELAGMFDADSDYGGGIGKCVKELLKTLQSQGHSGFSAERTVEVFSTLTDGGILVPLQGTSDEWIDRSKLSERPHFQNRRCSHVFAESDTGENAYDIHGKVFVPDLGSSYTNSSKSRVSVTFPYMPKTEYVHVGGNILVRLKQLIKSVVAKW